MTTKRDWAEQARLNESRLEAVLKLSQMTEASLQEITDFALEQAVALTRSKIGYLTFMNEDQTVLTMHSWSKSAMAQCAIADKPLVYPVVTTGLWGEAARQRKPIVTNDYAASNPWKKGIPEGHVQLRRHMNVPILDEGRIVVVAGVGNKEEEYDESDVRQLTLLMEGMWTLIQRQRVQAELKRYREHLEQSVKERTAELLAANEQLKREVEERKRVEQALRESEGKYETLVETSPDAVIMADLEGHIAFASRRILELHGSERVEELLGRNPLAFIAPEDHERFLATLQRTLEEGITRDIEYTFVRKDGAYFPGEISAAVIRDVSGKPRALAAIIRDIRERKQAEAALKKERQVLRHLLAASDHERQLIAYDIHDGLAQQLAAAIMQFQIFDHLKDKNTEEATRVREAGMAMLQQSHFEARRLISGVRPPILDESGIVAAIAHLVHDQSLERGPKIEFRSKVRFQRLASVLENAIYRIVQEGLANACKHSKSPKVRVGLAQHGDHVRVEIWDWGVGYEPNKPRKGCYGLEGIRQRARLLGGRASIRSTPGEGTRIRVELPVIEEEQEE